MCENDVSPNDLNRIKEAFYARNGSALEHMLSSGHLTDGINRKKNENISINNSNNELRKTVNATNLQHLLRALSADLLSLDKEVDVECDGSDVDGFYDY